jgi:hypothetical protein
MSNFAVIHFNNAARPIKEIRKFSTDDMTEAQQKYREWCAEGGERGTAVFYFDYALFGGTTAKHVF